MNKDTPAPEPPTCGQGLSEHASIPATMAEFLSALAENLDAHIPIVDAADENGHRERDAHVHLRSEYGAIAARLPAAAERMRGYRDLPPARHHQDALAEPRLLDVFGDLVVLASELAGLLRAPADRDGERLAQARSPEASP